MAPEALEIVISVKPEYLKMMLDGDKTVELRRKAMKVAPGSRVWLYAKAPTAKIAAYASIERIVTAAPRTIWTRYHSGVGISLDEFNAYFKGASLASAILLKGVHRIAPELTLEKLRSHLNGFHPPQFFKKLRKDSPESRLLHSHLK